MAAANCPEKTNWYQCIRLLMEGGGAVLKEFIKKSYIRTPGSLDLFLNLKPNKDSLSSLRRRNILNKDQWDKLFPSADLESMDITLLSCIICNCITQPNSVERRAVDVLRELRNSLHGHTSTQSMNKDEFERNWRKITTELSDAQQALGVSISLNESITKIENEKVVNNNLVWDELEAWERIDALMSDMKEQRKEMSDVKDEILCVKDRVSNIEKILEDKKKLTIDKKDLMAVSGQGATSQVTDSDIADLLCDQCSGQDVIAAGFCRTCPDYLCRKCINQHKKIRSLQHHEILEGADMPEKRPCSNGVEYCRLHPERRIEMFCSNDNTLGCTLCFTVGHKTCHSVGLISELSKDFKLSAEFCDFKDTLHRKRTLTKQKHEIIEKCRSSNNDCHSTIFDEFKLFRKEIDSLLDRMEVTVFEDAARFKQENEAKLDRLSDFIASCEKEIETYMTNIEEKEKHNKDDELFILVKKHSGSLRQHLKNLEELCGNIDIQKFRFVADHSVIQSLSKDTRIRICMEPATTCTAVSQINIKSCEDIDDCNITGITQISETQLIVSDRQNKCLKIVDVETYKIINRRQLSSRPRNVTMLRDSRVAVALPGVKQIQIFTTDRNLDQCGSIQVDGECIGLHCNGSQLFVSYDLPVAKVQIMDLMGRVQTTIQHDSSGTALFVDPKFLTYSPDNHRIYVSDRKKNTVTCITTDGKVQWNYSGPDVKYPMDLVLGDNEFMYICSQGTHSVHVVSAGGEKFAVITKDQTGIIYPKAVHYNSLSQTLYVCSNCERPEDRNFIRRLALT